jgi:hypothetical protein
VSEEPIGDALPIDIPHGHKQWRHLVLLSSRMAVATLLPQGELRSRFRLPLTTTEGIG